MTAGWRALLLALMWGCAPSPGPRASSSSEVAPPSAVTSAPSSSAAVPPSDTASPADAGALPAPCVDAAATKAPHVTIVLGEAGFDPACIIVKKEQALRLVNPTKRARNLSIPGTMVDLDVPPGSETNTEALGQVVPIGEHELRSKSQPSMRGRITVR